MMFKLLVEPEINKQDLIEVEISGSYFDQSKVLWDERVDGGFPANLLSKVGGLVRIGNTLSLNQSKLDAHKEANKPPVDQSRRDKILKQFPVHAQLEAITENLMGRPEKLEELKAFIVAVKAEFPKSQV